MRPRANCCSTRLVTRSEVNAAGSRTPIGDDRAEIKRRPRLGEMRGQRPAREEVDLERANQAQPVAGLDAQRRLRIDTPHHPPQTLDSAARRDGLQPRPQRRVLAGPGKQPSRQRPIVEPGPADQNRHAAARQDVADRGGRVARVVGGAVFGGRLDDVDEMVRDAALIGDRHLVGADVEAAVDRRRIAVDDLAAKPLGERQSERALARRRRAEHGDHPIPVHGFTGSGVHRFGVHRFCGSRVHRFCGSRVRRRRSSACQPVHP